MTRLDRHDFGLDRRFGAFLLDAPPASMAAVAAVVALGAGLSSAWESGNPLLLLAVAGVFVPGLVVGGALMLMNYVAAALPSILVWGATFRTARALGCSERRAAVFAGLTTALAATAIMAVWFSFMTSGGRVPLIEANWELLAVAPVTMAVSAFVAHRRFGPVPLPKRATAGQAPCQEPRSKPRREEP